MSRMSAVSASVLTALALFVGAHAQVRDQTGPPAQGGTISGRVELAGDSPRQPVRRAKVTLTGGPGGTSRTTFADADGRFTFEQLTNGRYQIQVAKSGFLPMGPAPSIDVRGAGTPSINVTLQRAGVITGRFLDARGEPIRNMAAWADRLDDPITLPPPSYSAQTDDLGRFRLHTLPPGRYRVYAFPLPPASGNKLFYPGTTDAAEAAIINVASGETRDRLDFVVPDDPSTASDTSAVAARSGVDDAATRMPSGLVSGRVTLAGTDLPIANAVVRLTPGRALSEIVHTNVRGQFEFPHLADDRYSLMVSKSGYLDTGSSTSLKTPTGYATPIVITNGKPVIDVDFALTPASAIEGQVLDEFGDPTPGVALLLMSATNASGLRQFGQVSAFRPTDDRGSFRIPNLHPGDYYLIALPEPFDPSGVSGFAPAFFPGTVSIDNATAIRVLPGQDSLDVAFRVASARIAKVSGRVVGVDGRPAAALQVLLLPTYDGEVRFTEMAKTSTDANGQFSFVRVPEGSYVLQVISQGSFASARIIVPAAADAGPAPVAIALRPLTTASGRIIFEGNAERPAPSRNLLTFLPTDRTMGPAVSNRPSTEISADLTFAISGLAGHGVIRANPPRGWALARVVLQGRDVTDTPTDFQAGDVSGLEVVLTNRVGGVSGSVLSGGQLAPNASVVIFATDNPSWLAMSRSLRTTETTAKGTFTVTDLLPGHYVAVATLSPELTDDPAGAFALQPLATPFTVTEGATTAGVIVKIIK